MSKGAHFQERPRNVTSKRCLFVKNCNTLMKFNHAVENLIYVYLTYILWASKFATAKIECSF